jgi:hypothetical protein
MQIQDTTQQVPDKSTEKKDFKLNFMIFNFQQQKKRGKTL